MEKDSFFLIAILTAVVLGVLAAVVFHEDEPLAPITCHTDEQCGGEVETARFCREGKLYANGQQNTCLRPGKTSSECSTSYDPWLLANNCE